MIRTLPLSTAVDSSDVVGDLSVCLDGMQVDPETFASEEQKHSKTYLFITYSKISPVQV